MAYILTPRFAQAYQASQCNPFGFCGPQSRSAYGYPTVKRSQPQPQPQPRSSPFASFFSQLEDLVSEIDRESQHQAHIEAQRREAQRAAQIEAQREAYEAHIQAQRTAYLQRQAQIEAHVAAQREAHRQRQLRKRQLRAQCAVTQNEQGWQVDAEIPGFEQQNISIEVTDENTLKIAGNTEWGTKPDAEATPIVEQPTEQLLTEQTTEEAVEQPTQETADEKVEDITLEPFAETTTDTTESIRPATPDSDTSSHKSYQATVEDDFEDLGPEASTLFSTSSAPAIPSEPRDKEKAVEPEESTEQHEAAEDPETSVPTETAVTQHSQLEAPAQQQESEERPRSSFERTYRFPERIDADNVRASFKEGKLTINVPRAQVQQARRIAIF